MTDAFSTETVSFEAVAEHYDELMRSVPYRMWVGYYLLVLSHQDVHPQSMLDVCCGTGTVTELLIDEGFEVEGFDLSAKMIEIAQMKAKERGQSVRYCVQDAATFDMGRRYDAAFSFYDSLNNILEPDRLSSAFHRVAEHLEPGGSFVFDMNTAYAFEMRMFDQQSLRKGKAIRYQWKGDWDERSQIITVTMDFWKDGNAFREVHRQRAYPIDTIRQMLYEAGFDDIQVFKSYSLKPPRDKSDRVHYCARR
jgi:ubiquinone/menaquinone biosynthesis C-methylase UbiE